MRAFSRTLASVALAAVACGPTDDTPAAGFHAAPATAPLPPGIVADVAGDAVPAVLVAQVAAAHAVSPRAALGSIVDDALFAAAARSAALDQTSAFAWQRATIHARALVDHLRAAAAAEGPPTAAEVADLTALHWRDVDLPERVRVMHAVVLRPDPASPILVTRARALAATFAQVALAATSPDDFESRIRAVPSDGLSVRIERLPPFAADGRIDDASDGAMDPTFARAAFSLPLPGATSGVVETPFGWHVIRLLERLPARHTSFESRRSAFHDEVLARRAGAALQAALASSDARASVTIATDADALLALVPRP